MSFGRWASGGVAAVVLAATFFVVIVGGTALQAQASCGVTSGGAGVTVPIEAGQTAYVRTIIGVGKARGVPERGWVVALAVALQESGLRNLSNPAYPQSLALTTDGSGGNRDSLGLFQQRPSAGWGTVGQLMDPVYEAAAFFGGPDVPPANPGLLDIAGWESLPVTVAGQRVQASASPGAYARWEGEAAQLAAANADAAPVAVLDRPSGSPAAGAGGYTGADGLCGPGGVLPPGGATGDAAAVIAAAQRWLGTPYSWGGGTLDGPSAGFGPGAGIVGFDCSSYTRYAYYQGTGLTLPRTAAGQYAATASRLVGLGGPDLTRLQPGDLLFWGSSPGGIHHVALYTGGGMLLEEPHTGLAAELVPVYGGDFYAATRPLASVPVSP
ncbi:MAG: NlpC/P60 family protein [Mycobacteriales bacterium]